MRKFNHFLTGFALLFTTSAYADMVQIPWHGDYKHNSAATWSRENKDDSGFSKNFNNGTPEEMGRVQKDGKLWMEIIPPLSATVPVPYVIVMHGCTGLDKVSNAWAHHVADVLNAEHVGVAILDSFGTRFMKHTCGMPDLHWGRRRADDAYSALDYLIEQKLALPDQVYLMGQSNGGIATLIAMSDIEADHPHTFAAGFPVTPSCINTPVKYGNYVRPMIIFAGAEDDANPSKYCVEMLKKKRADPIQLIVYKNSNHAFMFNYSGKYVVKGWTDSHGVDHMWHLSTNPVAEKDMMQTIIAAIKTHTYTKGVVVREIPPSHPASEEWKRIP